MSMCIYIVMIKSYNFYKILLNISQIFHIARTESSGTVKYLEKYTGFFTQTKLYLLPVIVAAVEFEFAVIVVGRLVEFVASVVRIGAVPVV